MKIDLSYDEIADICLTADGGYCGNCARDVARGFGFKVKEIDVAKLEKVIDEKMEEY